MTNMISTCCVVREEVVMFASRFCLLSLLLNMYAGQLVIRIVPGPLVSRLK